MRISEIAALVGVSPRAVRHYHQVGLLPEPERLANGYREYRLRDAVTLARIRRLTELGLSLESIRAALAGDRKRDLREVLVELDADLARQQDGIQARRERLAGLLAEAELDHDSTVSPELAGVLRGLPMAGSRIAELDRHLLMLIDTAGEVLLGQHTPFAAANFVIGCPASLPTSGFAHVSSGITADTFLKRTAIARADAGALTRMTPSVLALADHEGFPAHGDALRLRQT
jgi:DNA-binding transcriptional MerR regulator